jgi:hypothetical protein
MQRLQELPCFAFLHQKPQIWQNKTRLWVIIAQKASSCRWMIVFSVKGNQIPQKNVMH